MLTITTSTSTNNNVIPFPPRGLVRQTDLFHGPSSTMASTSIIGLIVKLVHRPCRSCQAVHHIVGSSCAMHSAKLTCAECGRFSGWMSRGEFIYAKMTVERYGPPTTAKNKKDF
jgi:hypothetical protein